MPNSIEILLDSNRGIYIPFAFVTEYKIELWGIDWPATRPCLDADGESYWDAWDHILDTAELTDDAGNVWHLHQDGDLFAYCDALMSDSEYEGFWGISRESEDIITGEI